MKNKPHIFSILFLLFACNTIFAQYGGYGGGYGGYSSGYGGYGGRMSQMGSMGGMNQHQEKPKEIPVEVTAVKNCPSKRASRLLRAR